MKKNINFKYRTLALTLILIFTIITVITALPTNYSGSNGTKENLFENLKDENDDDNINDKIKSIKSPKSSTIPTAPWWNASYKYRKLINITNPYGISLVNQGVNLTFNYKELIDAGHMNSSLKDIRIVENGVLRKYFFKKNFPSNDWATVWFETNISASTTEYDTYLYYGNNSVNVEYNYFIDERFGLHWYPFDEGSGGIAHDLGCGTLANGGLSGTPSWVSGELGHAIEFSQSGSYVQSNPGADITTGKVSLSFWVYLKQGSRTAVRKQSAAYLIEFGSDETDNPGSNPQFYVATPSGKNYYIWANAINYNEWYHIACTYNSTYSKMYINGVQKAVTVRLDVDHGTGPLQDSTYSFQIGYWGEIFYGIIDDVRVFNYSLSSEEICWISSYNRTLISLKLNAEQNMSSYISIITYDIDGRIVPFAEVCLVKHNFSTGVAQIVKNGTTSEDGSVDFSNIIFGVYNITVRYKLSSGVYLVVYNSTKENYKTPNWNIYNFTSLFYAIDITLNLTTIDFEIFDWDSNPLKHAYINMSYIAGGTVLTTLQLTEGKATFRGENREKYYYKIYYDNDDYENIPIPLNESYIYRSQYEQYEKFYQYKLLVNQSNRLDPDVAEYRIEEKIFTNGSISLHKKLNNANITLTSMDSLQEVKIYYLDENGGSAEGNLIYLNNSYVGGQQEDRIKINIRNPPRHSDNLANDNYEAYGLLIDVQGHNNTQCNGVIEVKSLESCYIYNKTAISKIKIKVVDTSDVAIPLVIVMVNKFNNKITELITDYQGYAYGKINDDTEFMYGRGVSYNFSLKYFGLTKNFNVTKTSPSQWIPGTWCQIYNYTLLENSSLSFTMQVNSENFKANFTNRLGPSSVTWGYNMTFSVNYTICDDYGKWTSGTGNWTYLNDPDEITCNFAGKSVTKNNPIGWHGIFNFTLNSSVFSAAGSSQSYLISISGRKLGYVDPEPVYFLVTINAIPTNFSIHNWNNPSLTITEYSQYYNELVNITVSYYPTGFITQRLRGAKLSYTWDYGSDSNIGEDPIRSGYYTFEINTSAAPTVAKYGIDVVLSLENYITKNFVAFLDILPRMTQLNKTTSLLHNSTIIWINDSYTWTYKYADKDTGNAIGNLENAFYYWYKIDEEGKPIGKPSASINLENETGNLYILDFNTENREVGSYAIFITFQKNNYEVRNAFIDLRIEYRVFTAKLTTTGQEGMKITRIKGYPIVLSLKLTDPTKTSSPSSVGSIATQAAASLTGATVKLSIAGLGKIYKFKEVASGVYNLTIETTDSAYQAFFVPQTLIANITIEKENYITQVLDITIVIDMEQWPIPGFPAFYFLLIVIGIGAVVGSLATYRYIQLSQIPTFVKKARAMKKAIKGSELISESLLYPSKEELILKKYGDKWESIGISLENILGIERRKIEPTSELKKERIKSLETKMRTLYGTIKEKAKKIDLKKEEAVKGGEE